MVRVARWALLVAAALACTYVEGSAKTKTVAVDPSGADCVEPSALAGIAKEHEAIVLKLQTEIKSLTSDVETLEKDVAKERAAVAQAEAELKAALAKLKEETARATALERNSQSAEKRNKALRKELDETTTVELSMAALLSSYYDEGLLWGENALAFAQDQLSDQSGAIQQLQDNLAEAKKTACAVTSKFYAENLAATVDPIAASVQKTVDPILADVHSAVTPHIAKYRPIVESEVAKAKEQVVQYSQEALRRAKLARLDAITLLEQNEHVANHAQKVIDGVLIVLAIPLVWLQLHLVLRLAWWLFTTALCITTCGLCCSGRKRSSKSKRKSSKKVPAAPLNSTLPLNGGASKKTATKTTQKTSSQKRSKKSKN